MESPPRRILVPVSGGEPDETAMRMACSVARQVKAQITVVYVVEVERNLPLEAAPEAELRRGEDLLDRMVALAREEKCAADAEILQAREAGPAVVEEATQQAVDLIVMGLAFRRRRGEYSLGSTAPYVLARAPCQVWIIREAAIDAARAAAAAGAAQAAEG